MKIITKSGSSCRQNRVNKEKNKFEKGKNLKPEAGKISRDQRAPTVLFSKPVYGFHIP